MCCGPYTVVGDRLLAAAWPSPAVAAIWETLLLEAQALRGLAAESGKSDKGLPPNPKKQSPPKNVEASEARAPLLTRRAADAQPTSRPPHRSLPAAGSASTPLTGHRAQRFLPQKTVVEFPQKAPFVFRKPGAKSEATQKGRNGAPNSSSSSSSSSSDSESDDEGDRPEAGPGVRNKRHGGSLKPKTSPEEEARAQKPHTGVARPSQQQGSPAKPSVSREARPTTTRPTPRVEAEAKHSVTERQPRKAATLAEGNPEKHAQVSADGPKSGSSAPATGEAGVRAPLPTAPSTAPGMRREPDGLWGTAGRVAATSESVAAEAPQRDAPALPAEEEDASMAPALVLQPQEESGALEQSAMQEPTPAPAEPCDISTYKNLQHHDYGTYTFLDLNLDLSKFRMPQPSSGRASPRH